MAFHVRLVDLAKELAAIGGQTFDVTTLAFSEIVSKGPESSCHATDAGEHHPGCLRGMVRSRLPQVVAGGAPHPDQRLRRLPSRLRV